MANGVVGYEVPQRTDVITGDVREGYSTADPRAAFEPGSKPIRSGGGGGGSPTSVPSQAQTNATEKKRKDEASRRIEEDRRRNLFEANKRFRGDLRDIHNQQDRITRTKELEREISRIQADSRLRRLEEGIVISTKLKTRGGEIIVVKENVADIRSRLKIEQQTDSRIPKVKGGDISVGTGVISKAMPGDFPIKSVKDPSLIRRGKEFVGGLLSLPGAASTTFAEVQKESEEQLAQTGRKIPTKDDQIFFPKKETLEFEPEFLTNKELEQLSFGGLETLIERKEKQLEVDVRNAVMDAQNKREPDFQEKINKINTDLKAGKITQPEAGKRLDSAEKEFKKEITLTAGRIVDTKTKEVKSYIDAVAKKQRIIRAALVAPIVFGESALLGVGLGAGIKGVSAGAKVLGVSKVATKSAVNIGFLGAAATQLPKGVNLAKDFRKNPTAVLLEITPAVAGFTVGINPKIVTDLKGLGKKYVKFQKKLLVDKRGKAGRSGQQQKQVQVQRGKKKVSFTSKEFKDRLRKASDNELRDFISKLKEDKTLTVTEKQKIGALILEEKTGVLMLTDEGNIIQGQLRLALGKIKPGTVKVSLPSGIQPRPPTPPKPGVLKSLDIKPKIEPKFIPDVPGAVPGVKEKSLFAGTQLAPPEETIFISKDLPQVKVTPITLSKSLVLDKDKEITSQLDSIKTDSPQKGLQLSILRKPQLEKEKQKSLLLSKSILLSKQQLQIKQKASQISRQLLMLSQAAKTKQQQKQIALLGLKFAQAAKVSKQKSRSRFGLPPSKIIIPKLKSGTSIKSRKKKRMISSKAFEVQVKRAGKFKAISDKPLPKGKALRLGTKKTVTTLAATFRLKEKGVTTEKDIKFRVPSKSFRPPKSGDKLTFVEKKQLRLKRGSGELTEILAIRGKKPKSSKKRRKKK